MKVLVSDSLADAAIRDMKAAGLDVVLKAGLAEEELIQFIPPFDCLVVRSATKVTAPVLAAAKKLKLVVRAGVGLDNIDVEAAKRHGVKVEATPTATTVSVAELTLGLMLSLARNIPQAHLSLARGEWKRKAFEGVELKGQILAVIGLGRIGQEVTKRAKAFGMHVIACDQLTDEEIAEALDISHFPLDEALAQADFVTLHLPLTDETKNLFNKEKLLKMKRGSRLINTSRGGIVNEKDLYDVLVAKHLSGAAIDVFEVEPPTKDNPLLQLSQVIAIPHLGASTYHGQARAGTDAARIIIEFAKSHE